MAIRTPRLHRLSLFTTSCLAALLALSAVSRSALAQRIDTSTRGERLVNLELAADPRGELGAEILGGSLGVLGGAAIGLLTIAALSPAHDTCDTDFCGVGEFLIGSGVGIVSILALVPVGVVVAGNATGGNGNAAVAVLGTLAGAASSAILLGAWSPEQDSMIVPAIVGTSALIVTGAILGYRLSADVQPALAPSADMKGLELSLRGRF